MKAHDLREKSVDELMMTEGDLRRELFNLKFQQATGEIENPMRIRAVRRDIARVLGVITEKNKLEAKKEDGK